MNLKFKKNINDNDLSFLEKKKINIYYTGFDLDYLPFNRSKKFILKKDIINFIYPKILSLFVDHIIMPPSFYIKLYKTSFYNYNIDIFNKYLSILYEQKYLISSIYKELNNPIDFLEIKKKEYKLSTNDIEQLKIFFKKIPILHRDEKLQSEGFRKNFIDRIIKSKNISGRTKDLLLKNLEKLKTEYGLVLSREKLINFINQLISYKEISKKEYINLYYEMNYCYYLEGAKTHNSNIASIGSVNYINIDNEVLLNKDNSLLIGYDPEIILCILNMFGIDLNVINLLNDNDIYIIKNSYEFKKFKFLYKDFVKELQYLIFINNKIDPKVLNNLYNEIINKFKIEYKKGLELTNKIQLIYNKTFDIIEYLIIPILSILMEKQYSIIIGFSPTILHYLKIKEKLYENFIMKIYANSKAFYNFIQFLKNLNQEIKYKIE